MKQKCGTILTNFFNCITKDFRFQFTKSIKDPQALIRSRESKLTPLYFAHRTVGTIRPF